MKVEILGEGKPEYALIACVHGVEDCGLKAMRKLKRSEHELKKAVKFILANEEAREEGERYIEKDLNRCFPGDPESDVHEERLAAELLEEVEGLKVLDFHSTESEPTPFGFFIDPRDLDLVKNSGLDTAVDLSWMPETMMNYMRGISVECGKPGSEEAAENAYDIMVNFLAAEGVIDADYRVSDPDIFSIFGEEKGSGYEFTARNFEKVEEGEVFARKEGEELRAEEDFYPIVMSTKGYSHKIGYKGRRVREEELETDDRDIVDVAKELIGQETVSPVKDPEIFRTMERYLQENGIKSDIHDIQGVKSLTAEIGNGCTSVCFNGHLDVVEPGVGWEVTDPFDPTVLDGKLYGRGATDMKAEVAAMMKAFVDLRRDPNFDGRAVLMISGDEEIGGENGTKALVESYYRDGDGFDYVINGEPTDLDIQTGTRGAFWLDVYLQGDTVHASRVEDAEKNVLKALPKALERLNEMELEVENKKLPDPTLAPTLISSDDTYNSLPAEVHIGMDIRYTPEQKTLEIRQRIEEELEDLEVDVVVESKVDHGGAYQLTDQRFRKIATEELQKVLGREPEHITEGGTSDGRYFAEKGTPYVEIGLNQEMVHRKDEYCEIEDLKKLREAYYLIAKRLTSEKEQRMETERAKQSRQD
ncbi:MAG: M20/M25/M40 family metallo-hydrolase [Candidatus Nanohaloarchaea archaeon]